jgi:hypothetical protein
VLFEGTQRERRDRRRFRVAVLLLIGLLPLLTALLYLVATHIPSR